MNKNNQTFSIKDLENLCGIKAHTIRIWEKRYALLSPERTDTNIRLYSIDNLKKLLNVSFLVNCGYKISRISKLTPEEVNEYVHSINSNQVSIDRSINELKLAMLNFNTNSFTNTYNKLLDRFEFKDIFYNIFIPFLNEIGMLWQTNTIDNSHEHFVSGLIKQKMASQIDLLQQKSLKSDTTYVLYLPLGESNDLSLLFLNTLILSKGYKTIFLGQNVSIDFLKNLSKLHSNLIFTSYFTVSPSKEDVNTYISEFKKEICDKNSHQFWVMGRQLKEISIPASINIKVIQSFQDFELLIN